MTAITHPLPVGTRVYYEDFAGCNGTIVQNDNTTPEFVAAVNAFNQKCETADIPTSEMDYILRLDPDDEIEPNGLLPVQGGGIQRVL